MLGDWGSGPTGGWFWGSGVGCTQGKLASGFCSPCRVQAGCSSSLGVVLRMWEGSSPTPPQSPFWMDRFPGVRWGNTRVVETLIQGHRVKWCPEPQGSYPRGWELAPQKHLHLPLTVRRASAVFFATQNLHISLSDPPLLPVFGEFSTFHGLSPQPFPRAVYTQFAKYLFSFPS